MLTIEEIDYYLKHIVVNEQQANKLIDQNTIIICTHLCDTQHYNNKILHKLFQDIDVHKIEVNCSMQDIPSLKSLINDPDSHTIIEVAIGTKVIITQNIDLIIGAINGTIFSIKFNKITQQLPPYVCFYNQ